MKFYYIITLLVIAYIKIDFSHQHGYLNEPPSRASAWLTDHDFAECCLNYDYNQMFCGGFATQWQKNGGKCGICGDPYDEPEPRTYERGGEKYLGKIVRKYNKGSQIPVTIQITANHMGHFEFRICNVDGWSTEATQECLNNNILKIGNTDQTKYSLGKGIFTASYNLALPSNLECDHCVLQWKYVTGNSWGVDPVTNLSCVGCGEVQENFLGCADISVIDPLNPRPSTTPSTTTRTEPMSTSNIWQTTTTSTNYWETPESSTNYWETTTRSTNYWETTTQSTNYWETASSTNYWETTTTSSSTTSTTTEDSSDYNGCKTRLEFGTIADISRIVSIYCNRMCKARCEGIIEEYQKSRRQLTSADKDVLACLETCPIMCSCN